MFSELGFKVTKGNAILNSKIFGDRTRLDSKPSNNIESRGKNIIKLNTKIIAYRCVEHSLS
jgi:hypothetical protein